MKSNRLKSYYQRHTALLLLVLLTLCLPLVTQAQSKRALVIGIGKQEDRAWDKINGDKDVPYVLEILQQADYHQIITCVNEEATKAGITAAFRVLTESCRKGDKIYIHYSGHGQQMRDKSRDEEDLLDECWIPYDAYRRPCQEDKGEKHLTDDEVNLLLTGIRNQIGNDGKMLVVIDACHSGDATRGTGETIRGVTDVFEAIQSFFSRPETAQHRATPHAERWITLSACESQQVNIEMKNPTVGKLTYAIYSNVKNQKIGSNAEFFRQLRIFINKHTGSRPQRPTMTGEITRYHISDVLK